MVPLAMVVGNELGHRSLEVPFAHQNHPVEAFLLDRPYKPLRVRIGRKRALHRVMHISHKFSRSRIRSIRSTAKPLSC